MWSFAVNARCICSTEQCTRPCMLPAYIGNQIYHPLHVLSQNNEITLALDHWHNRRNRNDRAIRSDTISVMTGSQTSVKMSLSPRMKRVECERHITHVIYLGALIQVSLVLRGLDQKKNEKQQQVETPAERKEKEDVIIHEDPIMLEESGLLVVLFRVRTTLLRSAFSLSSLSRRASSAGSWLASAFCVPRHITRLQVKGRETTHAPRSSPSYSSASPLPPVP
ncbi:hypothetical protein EI94DRAFT_768813 [Lactarius quietus]|nr:hypothetical protein EI94DRAFT_768813 [Lactarius quietus]